MSKIHIISIKNIHKSCPNTSIKKKIILNKIMHTVLVLAFALVLLHVHAQGQLEMVLPPRPQLLDVMEKVPTRHADQAAEKVASIEYNNVRSAH